MTHFAVVPLGEIADLQAGVGFPPDLQGRPSGDYPLAKVGDISRLGRTGASVLNTADHFVDEADLARLNARPIPAGSVLFAKIGEAIRQNHRVVAGCELLVDNNAMAAIPTQRVESRYLFQFLRTVDFYVLAPATTVPALRKSDLQRLPVPLPPLPEQRRIAEILDKADALRAKRRAALAQLDTLTQSIFLDMFGDPSTNPKGWPVLRIGDVADVQGGLQVTSARENLVHEVPYLRVANVYRGFLNLAEIKTIRATDAEIARTSLLEGDLLIVEGHGNPEEIGRGALWDGSIPLCVHQNHIIRARFSPEKVVPHFACEFLNSPGGRRHLLRAGKTTSGLNTISVSEVRGTPIALPPLAVQLKFARRLAAVGSLRSAGHTSLAELDTLFAALQHRAFRGDL